MKNYLIVLFLISLTSCNKNETLVEFELEESSIEHEMSFLEFNELLGTWFRSTPIKFGALRESPAFERGEYHIELKFKSNGEFEHRYTTLGFYENQSLTDSTSITIHKGIFTLVDNILNIERNSRTYIQIFDGENISRDTSIRETILQHEYQWPKAEIANIDSLKFTYHTITDEISSEQISPGIELREEIYKKK